MGEPGVPWVSSSKSSSRAVVGDSGRAVVVYEATSQRGRISVLVWGALDVLASLDQTWLFNEFEIIRIVR